MRYSYSSSPVYPGPGRGGSRLSRDTQTSLSPDTSSSSSGGSPGVPRPAERHSPSSVSWAVSWASSRWDVPGTSTEEGVQEASGIDARATLTGSSRCGGAAADNFKSERARQPEPTQDETLPPNQFRSQPHEPPSPHEPQHELLHRATPNQDTDIEHMPTNPDTMNPLSTGHTPTDELYP
ncbi:hypothetical protein CRENBAI_024908 [Crenichthys baileyi]|uniref:Uncharacterized protein n=1 Tax=Crenichthys baileyi TaxID=28760 RepID=A0AAV9QXD0_9TELE